MEMSGDWNQRKISLLEQKEEIEEPILEEFAEGLKVSPDAIKNYNEDAAFNIVAKTYNDGATSVNYNYTFNPIDKWVEALEEDKKLYERLLESEREKVEIMKRMLDGGK